MIEIVAILRTISLTGYVINVYIRDFSSPKRYVCNIRIRINITIAYDDNERTGCKIGTTHSSHL